MAVIDYVLLQALAINAGRALKTSNSDELSPAPPTMTGGATYRRLQRQQLLA